MTIPAIGPAAAALRAQVIATVERGLVEVVDAASSPAPPAKAPGRPASPVEAAVVAARAAAAGRQSGLAPLFADLERALAAPGLAPGVKAAIGQVLTLRTALGALAVPADVRRAVIQSGLFLEARLADVHKGDAPGSSDLKAALLGLRQALGAAPDRPAADPRPAASAPPPLRDGALAGQPAAAPRLTAGSDAAAIVPHLAREVDQALARQVLHQLASLPDGHGPAWMFEIPVATAQGTAVAQFEVERDGRNADGADGQPCRARFSIDVEPLGPLHVSLRLDAGRSSVTIWAEREETLARLQAETSGLANALPGEVVLRHGIPPAAAPSPGRFVDQSS